MFNKIMLIGRLTKDPDLKFTKNGKAVSRMTLAVDRKYKDQDGKKVADFIPIIAWTSLAETVANYLRKGAMIAVDGSLEIRNYEQDGITKYIAEVIAQDVRFLEKAEPKAKEN